MKIPLKGRWITLWLLLTMILVWGCSKEKGLYKEGVKALSKGNFAEAHGIFERVVQEGGNSQYAAMALLKLAHMARSLRQDPNKAIAYCNSLIRGDYPYAQKRDAWLLMAEIQAQDLGDPKKGLKTLEAMPPGSHFPDLREERMVEYAIEMGDTQRAYKLAKPFLQNAPLNKDKGFILMLAELCRSVGAWDQAERLYQSVIKTGKGYEVQEALLGLANLREDQGRLKDALAILRRLKRQGYRTGLVKAHIRHLRRRIYEERL